MKAMILAAGEGTRIRPLTLTTPKVLLKIGGIPLIQHTLSWLRRYSIRKVAINIHYLREEIEKFLGDGSQSGIELLYSTEESLMGTAGGVKNIESFFDGTFIVVYGDVLTDFNLGKMIEFHKEKKAAATLALMERIERQDVGLVELDADNRILSFTEKPSLSTASGGLMSGGVYVLEPSVLEYIPRDIYSDFAYDVFPKLIEYGLPMYGYILNNEDYLLDIGTNEKYKRANIDARTGKVKIFNG